MENELSKLRKTHTRTVVSRPWDFTEEELKMIEDLRRWMGCGRAEAVRTAIRFAVGKADG